jgi:hypothetical protein
MPTDRLANILKVYLEGELELDTAVAELTHLYVDQGCGFYLNEAECVPEFRERMGALAARLDAVRATPTRRPRHV